MTFTLSDAMFCSSTINHRVDRVLGFFSNCPNWDSPSLSLADECAPTFGSGASTHSLGGEGVAGLNSNEEIDSGIL